MGGRALWGFPTEGLLEAVSTESLLVSTRSGLDHHVFAARASPRNTFGTFEGSFGRVSGDMPTVATKNLISVHSLVGQFAPFCVMKQSA